MRELEEKEDNVLRTRKVGQANTFRILYQHKQMCIKRQVRRHKQPAQWQAKEAASARNGRGF
jgi:hypothetical protein